MSSLLRAQHPRLPLRARLGPGSGDGPASCRTCWLHRTLIHTEEALIILDKMMVFRSTQASSPTEGAKKTVLKTAKARLKFRKNTPAPPTKGNGQKRLDLSPFPEDKQLRKRIDFGDENSPTMEAPKCKGPIFPAKTPHEAEESSNKEEQEAGAPNNNDNEMRLVCSPSRIVDVSSPESGSAAGGEGVAGPEEDNFAIGSLVGEIVNLPKMDLETKSLLESCLVPCHVEGSHDALAVGSPMQPKNVNILHLASLNSAEMHDNIAAQPLLAGGPSEEGDSWSPSTYVNHSPTAERQ